MLKRVRLLSRLNTILHRKGARQKSILPKSKRVTSSVMMSCAALALTSGLATNPAKAQVLLDKDPSFVMNTVANPLGASFNSGTISLGIQFEDIDGDGDLDLIFHDEAGGDALFFRNTGDAISPSVYYSNDGSADGATAPNFEFGDLDADGDLDALLHTGGDIFFSENTGDSRNPSFPTYFSLSTFIDQNTFDSNDGRMHLVDIDGDGDQDLFLLDNQNEEYDFLENTGSATNPAFAPGVTNAFGLNPMLNMPFPMTDSITTSVLIFTQQTMGFSDLDKDGDLDAVVSHNTAAGNIFSLMENTGDAANPAFTFAGRSSTLFGINTFFLPSNIFVSAIDFSDIDGDGDEDLFLGLSNGTYIFAQNTADLTSAPDFQEPVVLPGLTNPITIQGAYGAYEVNTADLADIDKDGDLDLITLSTLYNYYYPITKGSGGNPVFYSYLSIDVFENTGNAISPSFSNSPENLDSYIVSSFAPYGQLNYLFNLDVCDLDGDGDFDLLFSYSYRTPFYIGGGVGVYNILNYGNAENPSFSFLNLANVNASPRSSISSLVSSFGDLNGDNVQDAIFFDYNTTRHSLDAGYNIGGVLSGFSLSNTFQPFDIFTIEIGELADFDSDGDLDSLVPINFSPDGFTLYNNLSSKINPGFTSVASTDFLFSLSSPYNVDNVVAGDLDADGDLDVVALLPENNFYLLDNGFVPPDITPPTIDIAPIANSADGPTSVAISFDEYVTGFDVSDLLLIDPAGQPVRGTDSLTMLRRDPAFFYVSGLDTLDLKTGPHILALDADGSGIQDYAGNYLAEGITEPFVVETTPTNATFVSVSSFPSGVPDIGTNTSPAFGDLDGDGDLDLILGGFPSVSIGYTLLFYRNIGTPEAHAFASEAFPATAALTLPGAIQPILVDMDFDGDLDIVVGGSYGYLQLVENIGSANNPLFSEVYNINPYGFNNVGGTNSFFSVVDIDNDGDLDVFTGEQNGNTYFAENVGTAFSPILTSLLSVNPFNIPQVTNSGNRRSAPSFVDLNFDGDLDLFTSDDSGEIYYTENTGNEQIASFSGSLTLGAFGFRNTIGLRVRSTFADIDNDGDLDAFFGENSGALRYYRNDAIVADTTPPTVDIAPIANAADGPPSVAITFDEDVYGFGLDDLLLLDPAGQPVLGLSTASFSGSGSDFYLQGLDSVPLRSGPHTLILNPDGSGVYDNAGNALVEGDHEPFTIARTPQTPTFVFETVNPFGIYNYGVENDLGFGDLNGDGDLDLILGSGSNFNPYYLANTGDAATPAFLSAGNRYFLGHTNPFLDVEPVLVDIDADGDLDIFMGEVYLFFQENTGSASSPSFAPYVQNPFGLTQSSGYDGSIAFGDIDSDGDLDAFYTYFFNGQIYQSLFINSGSPTEPAFVSAPLPASLLITLSGSSYASYITLNDLDFDGDLDFISGYDDRSLLLSNTGSFTSPRFEYGGTPFLPTVFGSKPNFADIDNDGDLDAFVGSSSGNTFFFRNTTGDDLTPPTVSISPIADGTDAPSSVTVTFSEYVSGFDVDDMALIDPAGHPVNIYGLFSTPGPDPYSYTVSGLNTLELDPGPHFLCVNAYGSDIEDYYGNYMVYGDYEAFAISGPVVTPDLDYEAFSPFGLSTINSFTPDSIQVDFADIDSDGDMDALLTFSYTTDLGSTGESRLVPFLNTGTPEVPAFQPTSLPGLNLFFTGQNGWATPEFVDIDNDGDLDLGIASRYGYIFFYENTGSSSGPAFQLRTGSDNPFNTTNGVGILPYIPGFTVADVDLDGDLDLFLSGQGVSQRFFENTGTAEAAAFMSAALPQTISTYAYPFAAFTDIDHDGDLDLFTDSGSNQASAFQINNGTPSSPMFQSPVFPTPFITTSRSTQSIFHDFVDIDNDGDMDLFISGRVSSNQLEFLRNSAIAPTGPTDTTPPVVFPPGDGGDVTSVSNLGFTWTAPFDPETGISNLTLCLGSTPLADDLGSFDVTGTTNTLVFGLPDGDVFAFLKATNGDGLTTSSASSDGILIDTQNVVVTLDGVPIITNNPTPTLTGTFMDPDPSSGVDEIQFRAVDNGYPAALFNATFDDSQTSGTWTGTLQTPLPVEGVYRAQLRGIDGAFNRAFTVINDAIIFDQTGPVITYFGTPGGDRFDFFVNGPFTLLVETMDNLSDVIGFDPNTLPDLNTNSLPATFTLTNAGPNTFEFTVEPSVENQQYQLMVGGPGAVFDGAGNPNLRGSSPVTFTYDITPPELLCDAAFAPVGGTVQNGDGAFVSVTFTEPVIGVTNDAFTVSGAGSLVGVSPSPGPDTTFVVEVERVSTGTVTVALNDGFITDRAGNAFVSGGASTSFDLIDPVNMLPDPAPYFAASPLGTGNLFGDDVDLRGPVAVVGAPGYGTTGAAIVLVGTDPTTYTETGIIQPADLDPGDNFGDAVATSGNWVLVGSSLDDDFDDATGAAYFFLGNDTFSTFTEVQKATVNDFAPTAIPERLGRFGQSVALDGISAAIGQPLGNRGGAVFVYTLDLCDGETGTWIPSQVVVPNDLTIRDNFGTDVAILGDTMVVGSRRDDDRGSDTGAVYVFRRLGGTWTQTAKIVPGDADRLDQHGTGVGIFNGGFDTLVGFGSPGDDDVASGAGAGYIFRRTSSEAFFFRAKLTVPASASGDGVGTSVDIYGPKMILGAPFADTMARDAGAAYLFRDTIGNGTYTLAPEDIITFPEPAARNDRFGQSVTLDGTTGIIGNPFTDQNGRNNGGVLMY